MTEIVWDATVPATVETLARPVVETAQALIPREYHHVYIRYDGEDSTVEANVRMRREYRTATITIGPRWLQLTELERRRALVHECLHLIIEPLDVPFLEAVKAVPGGAESAVGQVLVEMRRIAEEGAVCDLAMAVTPWLFP